MNPLFISAALQASTWGTANILLRNGVRVPLNASLAFVEPLYPNGAVTPGPVPVYTSYFENQWGKGPETTIALFTGGTGTGTFGPLIRP